MRISRNKLLIPLILTLAGCGALPPGWLSLNADSFPPPPVGQGVQLVAGPFPVPAGSETQKNFYMKLPVDHDVYLKKIVYDGTPGTHHCFVFKSDTNVPDHVETTWDFLDWTVYDLLADAQESHFTLNYPVGAGMPLHAHQQMVIQAHYVNSTVTGQVTPDSNALVKVNLYFADPKTITTSVGMMWGIQENINIPPHSAFTATKSVTFPAAKFPDGVDIFGMTGHFHVHGRRFRVWRYDGDKKGQLLYESDAWNDPPYKAFSPPIHVQPGGKLYYQSDYYNFSDQLVTFGPSALTQEHANLFLWFTPGATDGKPLYDIDYASEERQVAPPLAQ